MSAISKAAAFAATGTPPDSGGLKGWLRWLGYIAVGTAFSVPLAMSVLFKLITNPRHTLYRKDRSRLTYPELLPGLTHEWIETAPGIKLHAVRTSKGSGKPLMLLVHGFPEAWFSWRDQMAAFRDEYEVVAIDMRGYNESSRPKGVSAYRLDALVSDVATLAQHLLEEAGQQQLVLAGHDWGANVCWGVAATQPHLLRRLAILCVPHPRCFFANMDWDQFLRSWYIFAFQLPWLPEFALRAGDFEFCGKALTQPPSGCVTPGAISPEMVERYKQAFGRPGAPTAAINYYRAVIDSATRYPNRAFQKALGNKITMPTLLIWGGRDTALGPQLMRGTERYVERLRKVEIPDASHWVQQDKPEEVNRLLREFLADAKA